MATYSPHAENKYKANVSFSSITPAMPFYVASYFVFLLCAIFYYYIHLCIWRGRALKHLCSSTYVVQSPVNTAKLMEWISGLDKAL